jgi:hypothetical protein
MSILKFEEIKMLEDETFNEFYNRINDLRNSMVSLVKNVSNIKLIKKILRSLPERLRIKVTTIEESKDLESMKMKSWWDLFKLMSIPCCCANFNVLASERIICNIVLCKCEVDPTGNCVAKINLYSN